MTKLPSIAQTARLETNCWHTQRTGSILDEHFVRSHSMAFFNKLPLNSDGTILSGESYRKHEFIDSK